MAGVPQVMSKPATVLGSSAVGASFTSGAGAQRILAGAPPPQTRVVSAGATVSTASSLPVAGQAITSIASITAPATTISASVPKSVALPMSTVAAAPVTASVASMASPTTIKAAPSVLTGTPTVSYASPASVVSAAPAPSYISPASVVSALPATSVASAVSPASLVSPAARPAKVISSVGTPTSTATAAAPITVVGTSARPLVAPAAAPTLIGTSSLLAPSSEVISGAYPTRPAKVLSTGAAGSPAAVPVVTAATNRNSGSPIAVPVIAATAGAPLVTSATATSLSPVYVDPSTYTNYSGPSTYANAAPIVVTSSSQPAAAPGSRIAGPGASKTAYEKKHKDDDQLSNLKQVRKLCGLKGIPVMTAAESFKAASVNGLVPRDQFFDTYERLLDSHGIAQPSEDVKHAVFDLFDRDDNDVVDQMELVCGMTLLCKGNEDSKVEAVFLMFDMNGDGFVTVDEMQKFLTTIFKVVCTPNVMSVVNAVGPDIESAEDMARETTAECFQSADLNHDGKLSLAEFKKWFQADRCDPGLLFTPVKKMLN